MPVVTLEGKHMPVVTTLARQRVFFFDNLLVRIHFIIVMIRWTGIAPWEFEFPFSGSFTSTFLGWRDTIDCDSQPSDSRRGIGGSWPKGTQFLKLTCWGCGKNPSTLEFSFSSSSLLLSSLELSDSKVYAP